MTTFIAPQTTQLLVVDVCSSAFRQRGLESRKQLIVQISHFTQAARELGIRTTYVVIGPTPILYPGKTIWTPNATEINPEKMLIRFFGLTILKPRQDEDIVVKKGKNLFDCLPFTENIAKDKNLKNLIIVGTETSVCITETAKGAHKAGYNPIVIYDLVADPKIDITNGGPLAHDQKLQQTLKECKRTKLLTAKTCLSLFQTAHQ